MNHRADSGKKNLPGVALPPRNNKTCWLLSHTAARDKTRTAIKSLRCAQSLVFFEQREGESRNATLPRKPSRDSFRSRVAVISASRRARRANKRSPVAFAEPMPPSAEPRFARLPGPEFQGRNAAAALSLLRISSSWPLSAPAWCSSSQSWARCWSACRRGPDPARVPGGRTPCTAARAAPSSGSCRR